MQKTRRRRLRPGFVVLALSCLVYFALGVQAVQWALARAVPPAEWLAAGGAAEGQAEPVEAGSAALEAQPWNLLLVNGEHPLPEDFTVALTGLRNGQQVDERMYPALQEMMDDARAAGLSPLICSSYRTEEAQRALYLDKVSEFAEAGYPAAEAEELAAKWVARPGTSEHQTGLAVDIVAESYQHLDAAQADTPEQKWLMEHCWTYGFILRYPSDKAQKTGVCYEPWHYRYVGRLAALEMREREECLEEYLAAGR